MMEVEVMVVALVQVEVAMMGSSRNLTLCPHGFIKIDMIKEGRFGATMDCGKIESAHWGT